MITINNPVIEVGDGWSVERRVAKFGKRVFLRISKSALSETEDVINRFKIENVHIDNVPTLEDNILEILRDVKRLYWNGCQAPSALAAFKRLEALSISGEIQQLDLSSLDLKAISIKSHCADFSWKSLRSTEYVDISAVNLDSLDGIEQCEGLKCLVAGNRFLKSLCGIEFVPKLQSVVLGDLQFDPAGVISQCKYLVEFRGVYLPKLQKICFDSSAQTLKSVTFSKCKRLSGLDSLSSCRYLKVLNLSDIAIVENIDFVSELKELEIFTLVGSGFIRDGNTSPLLSCVRLKRISLQLRRSYSHSRLELESILGLREISDEEFESACSFVFYHYLNLL